MVESLHAFSSMDTRAKKPNILNMQCLRCCKDMKLGDMTQQCDLDLKDFANPSTSVVYHQEEMKAKNRTVKVTQ